MSKKGYTANPEIWGETLDGYVAASNSAAKRLRKAGIGATVRLTRYAVKNNVSVRASAKGAGVIAAFGDHLWTVFIRPNGYRRAHGSHPRFWEPIPKRRRAALRREPPAVDAKGKQVHDVRPSVDRVCELGIRGCVDVHKVRP